jgi:hypothetical protein
MLSSTSVVIKPRRIGTPALLLSLVPLAIASVGCEQVTRLEGEAGPCIPTAVQAAFDRNCAQGGCHDANGAGAGLSLTASASAGVLSATSTQTSMPLVVIGDVDGSYLAHKLVPDPPMPIVGVRMPVGYDPGNAEHAQDVATILAWIAGVELSGCAAGGSDTGVDSEGDTGTDPTGGEPNPFTVEPRCTSEIWWGDEDEGDPLMHPGRDCLSCHDDERLEDPDDDDIPDLVIAGTVYPTGHEPSDCYGESSASLRVVVQSMADGAEVELTPNASGNFMLHRTQAPAGFAPPFAVRLVDGERERMMVTPAPAGSCNACHTQDGTMNAPGRVVAP